MTGLECYLCKFCEKTKSDGSTWMGCAISRTQPCWIWDWPFTTDCVSPILGSYGLGRHCDYHKFAFGGENGIFTKKKEWLAKEVEA